MRPYLETLLVMATALLGACVAETPTVGFDGGFDSGSAFDLSLLPNCSTKRIKVVFTSPETMALGENTWLQAELLADGWKPTVDGDAGRTDASSGSMDGAVDAASTLDDGPREREHQNVALTLASDGGMQDASVSMDAGASADAGRFTVSWMLVNSDEYSAYGTLEPSFHCKPGAVSCVKFTCTKIGETARDAGTTQSVASVWIVAKYEDDTCFDTARVALNCAFPLVP